MRARRGLTLVELVVAIGLALAVAGVTHGLLLGARRASRAQAERAAMLDNVRTAALVLAGELGAVGYDAVGPEASAALGYPVGVRSDLLSIAPGSVTYLAGRGHGVACAAAGGLSEIRVGVESWRAPRAPRSADSLLVFAEGDAATDRDDAWLHLGVLSSGAGSCPDGSSALVLRVAAPAPLDGASALARVTAGAPVRLAEVMQMRYYASGGESWLGMRSVSTGEAITPVAGPFADSTAAGRGLTLTWRDAAGNETADPAAVRASDIALLGVTSRPVHGRSLRQPLVDSFALGGRLAPPNLLRP
jgi:hypothetical protein